MKYLYVNELEDKVQELLNEVKQMQEINHKLNDSNIRLANEIDRTKTKSKAISEVDVEDPWPNHSAIERRYVYDKLEELKSVVGNLHDSTRWEGRRIQSKLWDIQRWVYPEYNTRGRNQ